MRNNTNQDCIGGKSCMVYINFNFLDWIYNVNTVDKLRDADKYKNK